jgi:hypothetical protein
MEAGEDKPNYIGPGRIPAGTGEALSSSRLADYFSQKRLAFIRGQYCF